MTRLNPARLVAGLVLLLAVGPARAGNGDRGFMTNIALLDHLTRQAVESLLDSLAFDPGESISIVQSGGSEGDAFVTEAIARSLARRGFTVHLTEMPPAPAPAESPRGSSSPEGTEEEGQPEKEPQLPDFEILLSDSAKAYQDSVAQGLIDTTAIGFDDLLDRGDEDQSTQVPGAGTESSAGSTEEPAELESSDEPEGEESDTTGIGAEAPAGVAVPATPARPVPVRKIYPDGAVLEFRLLEFGVTYPSVKRKLLFFGKGSVNRLAGVYIHASSIEGPEGKILGVASGQAHWQDRLDGSSRALAEGAAYPFAKPTIPASNLGRVVEPIAVVAIISSLVYLFYQNQN